MVERDDVMRKYLIGFISGVVLAVSASAYAEEATTAVKNLIGLSVAGQFPVTVNGIVIDEPAAVIKVGEEDKGYLPIRALGEALNAEITFDADLGIMVDRTVTEAAYKEQVVSLEAEKLKMQEEIAVLKRQQKADKVQENQDILDSLDVQSMETNLQYKKQRLIGFEDQLRTLTNEAARPKLEAEIQTLKVEIAELEAKLQTVE